jgi:hypothetical protein
MADHAQQVAEHADDTLDDGDADVQDGEETLERPLKVAAIGSEELPNVAGQALEPVDKADEILRRSGREYVAERIVDRLECLSRAPGKKS